MEFVFDCGARLVILDDALDKVVSCFTSLGFSAECGGILLGSYDPIRLEYRIVDFTLPSQADKRSAFEFVRNKDVANTAIEKAWRESEGTVNYLGEWHTHDEIEPRPSTVDRSLMRNIIADNSCVFDHCFMLIFGGGGGVFCAMVQNGGNGEFVEAKRNCWKQLDKGYKHQSVLYAD